MFKNNVIDLSKRRELKDKEAATKSQHVKAIEKAPIVDMTKRREEILKEERREVRRTILTGFIGAFVVIPQPPGSKSKGGLLKVEVYDISEDGISFDVDPEYGQFKKGEEYAMRVYLSQNAYFPFAINIENIRRLEGDGTYRHGASFSKGSVNDEALFHFVKFIETVSASLERDTGDVMVSNLKK